MELIGASLIAGGVSLSVLNTCVTLSLGQEHSGPLAQTFGWVLAATLIISGMIASHIDDDPARPPK